MKKSDIPDGLMRKLRSRITKKGDCLIGPKKIHFQSQEWSTLVVLMAHRDDFSPEDGTVYRMTCGTPGCRNPDHAKWWTPDKDEDGDGMGLCLSESQHKRYLEMRKKAEARQRPRFRVPVYGLLLSDNGAVDGFEHREGMVL